MNLIEFILWRKNSIQKSLPLFWKFIDIISHSSFFRQTIPESNGSNKFLSY